MDREGDWLVRKGCAKCGLSVRNRERCDVSLEGRFDQTEQCIVWLPRCPGSHKLVKPERIVSITLFCDACQDPWWNGAIGGAVQPLRWLI